MDKLRTIDDLADELLDEILSFVLGSGRLLNEHFYDAPHNFPAGPDGNTTPKYGERTDLDRFRLVCRRFMRIGTPRKFAIFVLRFSREGFKRLDDLLGMQLACHVRYFTYMVRPFYHGSGWAQVLDGVGSDLSVSQLHRSRIEDQNFLIDSARDLSLLRLAIASFPSLQQVKLLRLQDESDERLLNNIRNRSLEETASSSWEPACSRAISNLGIALLESECRSVRFIGPQISPEAAVQLRHMPPATISAIGARLTSLDINFHSITDLTASFETLSSVFYSFFSAAKNLKTIHIGFPAKLPLDLRLEQVFHRIEWKGLRTFSIQGWRLRAHEIMDFSRRHRRQLRELRLSNIYLADDGRWRDVLSILHDEMEQLDRLDLHEIDYAGHFDTAKLTNGVVGDASSSSLAVVDHDPVLVSGVRRHFPFLNGQQRPSLSEAKLEKLRALTVDELGDDGVAVTQEQRVLWEAWVNASPRCVIYRQF